MTNTHIQNTCTSIPACKQLSLAKITRLVNFRTCSTILASVFLYLAGPVEVRSQSVAITWDSGYDGTVTFDGISIHPPYLVGEVRFPNSFGSDARYRAVENYNGMTNTEDLNTLQEAINHFQDHIRDTDYQGFADDDAKEYGLRTGLDLGYWYSKNSKLCPGESDVRCFDVLFVPNERLIVENLVSGTTFTSEYTLYNGQTSASGSTSVAINYDASVFSVGFEFGSRNTAVAEGETVTLNVIMNSALNTDLTIPITVTPGTAVSGTDYTPPTTAAVTIPMGETKGTISIPTLHNPNSEADSMFTVSLTEGNNYTIPPSARTASVSLMNHEVSMLWDDNQANPIDLVSLPAGDLSGSISVGTVHATSQPSIDISERKLGATVGDWDAADVTDCNAMGASCPTVTGAIKVYGLADFEFGVWYHAVDAKKFYFRPKSGALDLLDIGEAFESSFLLAYGNAERSVTVRLTKTGTKLTWDDGGTVRKSYSSEYGPISGKAVLGKLDNQTFEVSATGLVNSQTVERISVSSSVNVGYAANEIGADFDFGTWYWADDNSRFEFHPNADAVNGLSSSETVTSELTVRIKSGADAVATNTIVSTIVGRALPVLTIRPGPEQDSLSESSESATFIVTSSVRPPNDMIAAVNFEAGSNQPSFLSNGASSLSFAKDLDFSGVTQAPYEVSVSVDIKDDDQIDQPDGAIAATIVAGEGYTVGSSNTATVDVADDDVPVISVAAGSSVTEGSTDPVVFTVSSDIERQGVDLVINYTADQGNHNFVAPAELAATTVTLAPGLSSATAQVRFAVIDDNANEPDGEVRITLNSGAGYTIGSDSSAVVSITDDEPETIPVLSISNASITQSGGNIEFPVTANIQPAGPLTVRFTANDGSKNFLSQSPLTSSQVRTFTDKKATLSIATSTSTSDVSGTITVTLQDDDMSPATYEVASSPHNSASGTVFDAADVPQIRISEVNNLGEDLDPAEVTEGESSRVFAHFRLDSNTITISNTLRVNVAISDPGIVSEFGIDYGENFEGWVRFSAFQGRGTYRISISDDSVFQTHQYITVQLLEAGGGSDLYVLDPTGPTTARTKILDNDAPTGVSVLSLGDVDEAGPSRFQIRLHTAVPDNSSTTVNYSLVEAGDNDFLPDGASLSRTVTLSAGESFKDIEIAHDPAKASDTAVQGDGTLTLTLTLNAPTNSGDYTLTTDSSLQNATVNVKEDDQERTLSIGNLTASAFENAQVMVPVVSNIDIDGSLDVHYTLETVTGNFLASSPQSGDGAVAFNGTKEGELPVSFHDDGVGESTGSVRITLVQDATNMGSYGVSDTENAKTLILYDDDAPEIWFESTTAAIDEDAGTVELTVRSRFLPPNTSTPPNSLMIEFATSNPAGNFLGMNNSPQLVAFAADMAGGMASGTLSIVLDDDGVDESDGSFDVTLSADSANPVKYTVASSNGSVAMTVRDDDVPVLSIAGAGDAMESGDSGAIANAVFTVVSDKPTDQTFAVRYRPENVASNFIEAPTSPDYLETDLTFSLDTNTSKYTAQISVPIVGDAVRERTGAVRVTLLENATADATLNTYDVTAVHADRSATVSVHDDDLPVLSIGNAPEVSENEPALFVVTSTIDPGGMLTVHHRPENIANEGDFLGPKHNVPVTGQTSAFTDSGGGVYTASLSVAPHDDSVAEVHGSFRVVLLEESTIVGDTFRNYVLTGVAADISATVEVMDEDRPNLSIAVPDPIDEPEGTTQATVNFTVTTPIAPIGNQLTVGYTATNEAGTYLAETGSDLTAVLNFNTDGDGNITANLPITIVGNPDRESSGRIKVELTEMTPTTYYLNDKRKSATLKIFDDEIPEIWFETTTVEVNEDAGSAEITVRSRFLPPSASTPPNSLMISFTTSNVVGDFLGTNTSPQTVAFTEDTSGGTASGTLSIVLDDDNLEESDGSFDLNLSADPADPDNYTVAPTENVSTVTVTDDDLPTLSIASPDQINKPTGTTPTTVNFTVSSTVMPINNPLTVRFTATNVSGRYLAAGNGPTADLNFTTDGSGKITANLPIMLTGSNSGSAGAVRVQLAVMNPLTYNVDEAAKNATLSILDPFVPNEITITSGASINEGEDAVFTIRSSQGANSEVGIAVTQVGNHIFSPVPSEVTLVNGLLTLRILTYDNAEDDPDNGSITVTLIDGTGYDIPADMDDRSATVVVSDNDPAGGSTDTRYSVASSVISAILLEIPDTPATGPAEIKPAVSISADLSAVEEGTTAMFTLTATRVVLSDIKVMVTLTEVGDFLKGKTETYGTIRYGNTTGLIAVPIVNDDVAERDGSIQVRIEDGEDYVVGTIGTASVVVSDANDRRVRRNLLDGANRAALSQVAGSLGSRLLDTAKHRVGQAFSASGGSSFELDGVSTMAGLLHSGIESADQGVRPWQEVLGDSSFAAGLFPEEGIDSPATVWGLGDYRSFDRSGGVDGNAVAAHLGFDVPVSDGMVAGLASSMTRFDMEYKGGNELVAFQARSTGLHPYLGFESTEGAHRLQLITGYGVGWIELDQDGYETETLATSFFNFGVSGEMKLYSSENILQGGNSQLSVSGESWMASQFAVGRNDAVSNMRSDARHLRISAVGTHMHELASGSIAPEVSLRLREDGMKDQSFLGMELGGGLDYSNIRGYRISGNGGLVQSGVGRIHEWGVSGTLSYDSLGDRLGILLDFNPAWGQLVSDDDSALWGRSILTHELDSGMYTDGAKILAGIGYGIRVWEATGVLTPYSRVGLTRDDDEIRLGSRLRIGSDIEIELEGSQVYKEAGKNKSNVGFGSTIRW